MNRHVFAIAAGCLLASCGGGGSSEPAAVASQGDAPSSAMPADGPAAMPASQSPAAPTNQPPPAFAMCTSCHSVTPGENRIGPSLAGVFGRAAGAGAGYAYSEAMKGSGLTWDEAALDKYLTNPRTDIPGNKMTFAGIADPARRKAVIDYLKTLK